jgi:preprotein translocase subunit SecE
MLDNLKDSPEHVSGWFGRGRRFITDVRAELARVTWPTRREVWATTIVVIFVSLIFGVYLPGRSRAVYIGGMDLPPGRNVRREYRSPRRPNHD